MVRGGIPLPLPAQVTRIESPALASQPALAPVLVADPPAGGAAVTGDGYQLTLPSCWTEVHLGIAGEVGHFETQTDVLTVLRASGGPLVAPDGYAESVGGPWRRGLERTSASRSIVRIGELVVIDDIYRGTVGGRPELLRQLTTVVGTQGIALLFRYIEPNEAQALSESSSIAASWRGAGPYPISCFRAPPFPTPAPGRRARPTPPPAPAPDPPRVSPAPLSYGVGCRAGIQSHTA